MRVSPPGLFPATPKFEAQRKTKQGGRAKPAATRGNAIQYDPESALAI
jgi:hypothetical protein